MRGMWCPSVPQHEQGSSLRCGMCLMPTVAAACKLPTAHACGAPPQLATFAAAPAAPRRHAPAAGRCVFTHGSVISTPHCCVLGMPRAHGAGRCLKCVLPRARTLRYMPCAKQPRQYI
eukprot:scaffold37_cov116-Isochrysis_galbana.AAC.3